MAEKVEGSHLILEEIKKRGLHGAWIPSNDYGKYMRVVQSVINVEAQTAEAERELLGGDPWRVVANVVVLGTDIWPFNSGEPWDPITFRMHYTKARARATEKRAGPKSGPRDLKDLLEQERAHE